MNRLYFRARLSKWCRQHDWVFVLITDCSEANRIQAADLVWQGPPDPPSADCVASSGWCRYGTEWRRSWTDRAELDSWNIGRQDQWWNPLRHWDYQIRMAIWKAYLSLTCHLKTVFGPQSGWRRKKLGSLWTVASMSENVMSWTFENLCVEKSFSPGLEDKSEVLFPEQYPGRLSADFFHVDIHNHQICSLLIRVILYKLQVHHWLWTLKYIKSQEKM